MINVTGSEGSKQAGSGQGPAEHSKTVSESGSELILDLQKLDLRKLVGAAGAEMLLGESAEDMEKKFTKMQEEGKLEAFLDASDNAAWKKKAKAQQWGNENSEYDPDALSSEKQFPKSKLIGEKRKRKKADKIEDKQFPKMLKKAC